MYKKAIVEFGCVLCWCSELTDEQIQHILTERPEATIKCVEIE